MTGDRSEVRKEFDAAVNMTRSELERWLATDESREVGIARGAKKIEPGGDESVGHASGRRIVQIMDKDQADLDDDDYAHMGKVAGYVKRHLAQKPTKEPVEDSRWRRSLMNWGHDPLKPRKHNNP